MSKYVLFGLLCMAAAASASAHVYKSIGPDGKVTYSDHPVDKPSASVSVIKADVVHAVSVAKQAAPVSAAPVAHVTFLAASAEELEASRKAGVLALAGPKEVCDNRIDVLVGRNGEIVKKLSPSRLSAFKTN